MAKKNLTTSVAKTITYKDVENKIINIRNMSVILDSDVARLYQVETRTLNQAVGRNKDKFPPGYIIELTAEEKTGVISTLEKELYFNKLPEDITKCDTLNTVKYSKTFPKAFTEKGLCMLATILKSPVATQTTLLIIDIFTKTRELERAIQQTENLPENSIGK